VSSGEDVYDEPDGGQDGAFVYPAASTVLAKDKLREDMLGYGRNPLNAVGRSHPGKDKWIGGTANFGFVDGHAERMSVLDSITRRLWGDRYYSLTGNNTRVR
jgi:prepilin-type processing-associated H-X9-DG protein